MLRRHRTLALSFALTALAAASLPACATRSVVEPTFERQRVEVSLRSEKRWLGGEVERHFQHPVSLSNERLLHILSALDVERKSDEADGLRVRVPALNAEQIGNITAGLSDALEKAGPNQEVVVIAVRKQQRLGLFHKKFLTSFIAFVRDDHLNLAFSRIEWEIPREREDKKLPVPRLGQRVMNFRVAPGRGMHSAGAQTVAVPWRNPIYAMPVRPAEQTGKNARRTILFDSAVPEEGDPADAPLPTDLSPNVLRELADLEEARRAGTITEAQYQQRRAVLLGETR